MIGKSSVAVVVLLARVDHFALTKQRERISTKGVLVAGKKSICASEAFDVGMYLMDSCIVARGLRRGRVSRSVA